MTGESVLVFGATGAVGGAAAQEAAERGSKVWLATRDPSKPISWLTKDKESDGTYTRLKADLGDPESVKDAVKKSGAKSAFLYLAHGISTKPTFQALKDAGITWIVLLSSFTISGDITKYTKDMYIPYHHAVGELELREVGVAYAAVRPGYFASNISFTYVPQFKKTGEVNLLFPDKVNYDFVVPENIGQVAGALLTQPKPDLNPQEPEIVYVYGPNFENLEVVGKKIGKAMGKDIKVNSVSEEQYRKELEAAGMPGPQVHYLVEQQKLTAKGEFYNKEAAHDQKTNIQKYTGKKPITFDEYLESIKSELN